MFFNKIYDIILSINIDLEVSNYMKINDSKNNEQNKDLNNNCKRIVEMYITARQFKNAVNDNEMVIVPANQKGLLENNIIGVGNCFKITARGDKIVTKFFPFIVNKAFACEVYLKLILKEDGFDINKLDSRDRHKLDVLYKKTNASFKEYIIKTFSKVYGSKINLEIEIKKISNVFTKWRYIYEYVDKVNTVNYGFLNVFCEILDRYAYQLIKAKYNYNVDEDIR